VVGVLAAVIWGGSDFVERDELADGCDGLVESFLRADGGALVILPPTLLLTGLGDVHVPFLALLIVSVAPVSAFWWWMLHSESGDVGRRGGADVSR